MATHQIPRNVKGEGRILMIFTTKSLICSAVGAGIGLLIYYLISIVVQSFWVQIIITLFFASIGFGISTITIPESNNFEITKKLSGEKIDEVIIRYFKFKKKNKRIYVYTKEENKNE